jgi:glucan phosphoethanolaminetransferase (alkaline phosphatase superfamily)
MILFLILLLFFAAFLYILYLLIKWISNKKKRIQWAFGIIGILIFVNIIDLVFFTKMEFIQSKVYPHLYLVKNPINNQDSLNAIIKNRVVQKMNTEFIGRENKYKQKYQYTSESPSTTYLSYSIRFYSYYKGWETNPFGEAGTEHFINNKEDPGGFSSELLEYYDDYRIAEFDIRFCKNDTINYFGVLKYFQNGQEIKTDTIINQCKKE